MERNSLTLSLSLSLSLTVRIVYCSWEILQIAFGVISKLRYVSICLWANTGVLMCGSPLQKVTYDFVLTSPACLLRLNCMVFHIEVKWPYSSCFVWCCFRVLLQKHVAFWCGSYMAISTSVRLVSRWCSYTEEATRLQLQINPVLFYQSSYFHMIKSRSNFCDERVFIMNIFIYLIFPAS